MDKVHKVALARSGKLRHSADQPGLPAQSAATSWPELPQEPKWFVICHYF